MKLTPILFLVFYLTSLTIKGMVSELIILEPQSIEHKLSEEDLNHFKITLFNDTRTDSLLIPRYNNCLFLKGKLTQYNGQFILFDKKINFSQIKLEHPSFLTSFYQLNKAILDKDSIDQFNKKHHIHIYKTTLELIVECPEKQPFDFLFYSNEKPLGGYNYDNLIGALFKDSLSNDSLKSIGSALKLTFYAKSFTGREVIYKLQKGNLKPGKNTAIANLLMDSLRIKDAGIMIDTNSFSFFSSFYKIHALTLHQIEKMKMEPISGLKSFSKSMEYIKTNEMEMGCGLYQLKSGIGLQIIKWQTEIRVDEFDDKCKEQKKLNENDKKFVTLHTRTFSISGGKDLGKKKVNNEKRMAQIHEEDKALNKDYKCPLGYIEPIVIKAE